MALSLPYNLVFVPLDVLTAEELNNLMADISYISNQFPLTSSNIGSGAIGSTQLATNAVTSAKISSGAVTSTALSALAVGANAFNYSSVLNSYTVTSSINTPLSTDYTNILSRSLSTYPAGSMILAIATAYTNGTATETGITMRFSDTVSYSSEYSQANSWGKTITAHYVLESKSSSNTYMRVQMKKDNSSSSSVGVGARLTVIRIG